MSMFGCYQIDENGNDVMMLDQDGPYLVETRVVAPFTSLCKINGSIYAARRFENEDDARAHHIDVAAEVHLAAERLRQRLSEQPQ